MAEFIRTITVHVEVDTNKQTYVLDLDDDDYAPDEFPGAVREFIESHPMTASTLAVTDFVLARIAEDEAAVVAEARPFVGHVEDPEGEYWWECGWCYREGGHVSAAALAPAAQVEHAKSAHPTNPRVLAQCAAMRKIVEQVSDVSWCGYAVRDVVLGHLASIWSDHPDWREEWA